ncbi:unnamed protein product [Ectocarpus sp. 12 AP-2014]
MTRSDAFLATAVALMAAAGSYPSTFASALELTAANCDDLGALPTTLTEDTNLLLDVPTITYGNPDLNWISCDTITTVHVDGPYKFIVTTDMDNYNFENARFEVKGGADLTFAIEGRFSFNYAESQGTDGGAIYVESGSSATFDVPSKVNFEGNTVEAGYSGGVVYAGGEVVFTGDAVFISNEARSSGDEPAGYGGAVAVGPEGSLEFQGALEFTDNKAQSGGSGGAIANFGSLVFRRKSYFWFNTAAEDAIGDGGFGGAIYAGYGSTTEFFRRTIWFYSEAASGGALYNLGEVMLYSNGFIRGNKAVGSVKAEGGHIYNLASVVGGEPIYTGGQIQLNGDKVNFREGEAKRGGAYFSGGPGSSLSYHTAPNLFDNSASEYCDDYASGNTDPPTCSS